MNQKTNPTAANDVRALNYKQLAALYAVTHKTLKCWLEPFMAEIGQMRGKAFTIKQVRTIYDKLGEPGPSFFRGTM